MRLPWNAVWICVGLVSIQAQQESSSAPVENSHKIIVEGKTVIVDFVNEDRPVSSNIESRCYRYSMNFKAETYPIEVKIGRSHTGPVIVQGGTVTIKGAGFKGPLSVKAGTLTLESLSPFQRLSFHAGVVQGKAENLSGPVDMNAGSVDVILGYKPLTDEKSPKGLRFGGPFALNAKVGSGTITVKAPKDFKISSSKSYSFHQGKGSFKREKTDKNNSPDLIIKTVGHVSLRLSQEG